MKFLTLVDSPAVGGGLCMPANTEFDPYEIQFHYDKFLQTYVFKEGTRRKVVKGEFKINIHYRRLDAVKRQETNSGF